MGVQNPSGKLADGAVAAAVRRALRSGISLTLGTCLFVASAHAAEPTSAASGEKDNVRKTTLEEVVVTGIRQSLESAQAIKQDAEQIVDAVTAQDIGALPDRSVSEALQRIPGITLQRTNEARDPARLASEGGGVFIRGLSWVRSETNGRDVFSANNGRALSFEDVSADLLSGINVYKNPSAEMIEGGIGGTVDLRTRLPFDTTKRLFAFSADYNYADLREEGFTSGNALYSDSWDTSIGRLGVLLSYSEGNIGNRTDSIQTGRYEAFTLPSGDVLYAPNSLGWRRIDWEQKRTAANIALQWAPNDELVMTFQALQAKADPKDIERAVGDYTPFYDGSNAVFDNQNVLVAGTDLNTSIDTDSRFTEQHKKTSDYSFNIKYSPTDHWVVSGDLQYVKSEASVVSMTAYTEQKSQTGTLDFDLRGDTPHMVWNEPGQANKDDYWWAAAMDHIEDNDAREYAARADAEYTFDDNPWLKSFRFGIRGTDKEATTRQTGYNWSLLSQQFWGPNDPNTPAGNDNIVYINETGFGSSNAASLPSAVQLIKFGNFFRGNVQVPGVAWLPSQALVGNGTQNAFGLLRNTQSSFWGWTPLTAKSYSDAHPAGDNVTGGINDQNETTKALYGVLRFARDEGFLGRWDGNIGVRVVKTETDASGLALTVAALQGGDPAGCAAQAAIDPNLNCATFNAAYAFTQGGASLPPVDASNSYTDVLPTLNLRFFLRDDLQLRFAAGKAISRPSFAQMVPYTTLGFNFVNGYYPNVTGAATASGGNPQLKPTRSNQFDTSLEWYFAPGGSVTGAVFYKDIKDYIFIGNSQESYTSGGQTISFLTSRNMNGAKGKVQGLEVGYQQFYDFLPGILSGFGLQANFTYVDSSGGKNTAINVLEPAQVTGAQDQELPLEGLSKTSYNVALMYEKHDVSARLAYNWREKYLLTTSAANIQRPVWMEDYGQLDASVFYSITSSVKVGVQATNVLNTRTFLDVGGVTLNPRYSWTDTDRRIAFAIRTSF
jgi:TonB-dependent receptor